MKKVIKVKEKVVAGTTCLFTFFFKKGINFSKD